MHLLDVRLSFRHIRLPHAAAAGLLLWARLQQQTRSMAHSSKCGQCHVVS